MAEASEGQPGPREVGGDGSPGGEAPIAVAATELPSDGNGPVDVGAGVSSDGDSTLEAAAAKLSSDGDTPRSAEVIGAEASSDADEQALTVPDMTDLYRRLLRELTQRFGGTIDDANADAIAYAAAELYHRDFEPRLWQEKSAHDLLDLFGVPRAGVFAPYSLSDRLVLFQRRSSQAQYITRAHEVLTALGVPGKDESGVERPLKWRLDQVLESVNGAAEEAQTAEAGGEAGTEGAGKAKSTSTEAKGDRHGKGRRRKRGRAEEPQGEGDEAGDGGEGDDSGGAADGGGGEGGEAGDGGEGDEAGEGGAGGEAKEADGEGADGGNGGDGEPGGGEAGGGEAGGGEARGGEGGDAGSDGKRGGLEARQGGGGGEATGPGGAAIEVGAGGSGGKGDEDAATTKAADADGEGAGPKLDEAAEGAGPKLDEAAEGADLAIGRGGSKSSGALDLTGVGRPKDPDDGAPAESQAVDSGAAGAEPSAAQLVDAVRALEQAAQAEADLAKTDTGLDLVSLTERLKGIEGEIAGLRDLVEAFEIGMRRQLDELQAQMAAIANGVPTPPPSSGPAPILPQPVDPTRVMLPVELQAEAMSDAEAEAGPVRRSLRRVLLVVLLVVLGVLIAGGIALGVAVGWESIRSHLPGLLLPPG